MKLLFTLIFAVMVSAAAPSDAFCIPDSKVEKIYKGKKKRKAKKRKGRRNGKPSFLF